MKAESVIAAALLVLAGAAAVRTEPERSAASGGAKSSPVKLEPIPGSTAKRVTLTAKAAERLGIQTAKVREESVVRRLLVSGLVTAPVAAPMAVKPGATGFASFTLHSALAAAQKPLAVRASTAPSRAAPESGAAQRMAVPAVAEEPPPVQEPIKGDAWILVTLSRGEWDRLDAQKPARVLPLTTREAAAKEILAQPSGIAPIEDAKRAMLTLYYVVKGKDHGLVLNKRVRVELQQAGSEEKRNVVPYAAVYYDAKGSTWAFVNTAPLVYERRRIGVERIMGDLAVLSDGPPVGTDVVAVGAPLLYGTEIFGK